MDRRSWPWKKKSSSEKAEKAAAATLDSVLAASASAGSQGEQVWPLISVTQFYNNNC